MTVPSPLRITADEVNCLIYSYFQDSGLVHSAFNILHEGNIQHSPYLARHIPRGELVDLLGKALLYLEVEAHWNPDAVTTNCRAGFGLLEPHVCSSEAATLKPSTRPTPAVSVPPLSAAQAFSSTHKQPSHVPLTAPYRPTASTSTRTPAPAPSQSAPGPSTSSLSVYDTGSKRKTSPVPSFEPVEKRQKTESIAETTMSNVTDSSSVQRQADLFKLSSPSARRRAQGPGNDRSDPRAVRMLPGHNTEVFVCAWNPRYPGTLSTGSKDSEVIIWDLSPKATNPDEFVRDGRIASTLGKLSNALQGDLTSLHWSSDGKFLAIGSYDSIFRVALSDGSLWMSSDMHEGPIFAARFQRRGNLLVTASLDGTACVWDVAQKRLYRHYHAHTDCCLDADWLTDKIFATAGADMRVFVMHIDQDEPLKIFDGHEDEVNQLRVNASGTRLASCSDDHTARIWKIDNLVPSRDAIPGLSTSDSPAVVVAHDEPTTTVAWCPTTVLSKGHELLATASFDKTAKIWDSVTGECLATFADHERPVYTIAFSPDGRFLATGGADGWLYIYSTTTYTQVYSWYAGPEKPGVFEMDWQMKSGYNRLVLALECREVMVLDCSKVPELNEGAAVRSPTTNGDSRALATINIPQ